jgi:Poxvirus A32 protein
MTGETEEIAAELQAKYPAIIKINHPSRILITGRSQSGKTTFGAELLMWMHTKVDFVILCSPTFHLQETWKDVLKYVNEAYEDPTEAIARVKEKSESGDRIFLMMDDLSFDRVLNTGNKGPISELAYNAVWLNLSMCIICHKIVNVSNSVRDNVQHLFLFQSINEEEIAQVTNTFAITPSQKDTKLLYRKLVTEVVMSGKNHYPFIYVCYVKGINVYNCLKERINITTYSGYH